jgi:hypothetical protein
VRPVSLVGGTFGRDSHCEQCLKDKREATRSGKTDKAPKRRTRRTSSTGPDAPPRPSSGRRQALAPRLEQLIGTVGFAVCMANMTDGTAILNGAPALASALDDLARENPRVRKVLEGLLATGAWSGVAIAAANIAMPILANHDMLPAVPFAMGSPAPAPDSEPEHEAPAPASEFGGSGASGLA